MDIEQYRKMTDRDIGDIKMRLARQEEQSRALTQLLDAICDRVADLVERVDVLAHRQADTSAALSRHTEAAEELSQPLRDLLGASRVTRFVIGVLMALLGIAATIWSLLPHSGNHQI